MLLSDAGGLLLATKLRECRPSFVARLIPASHNPPCAKEHFVLRFGGKNRRHRAIAMAVHILLIAFSYTILSAIEDLRAICLKTRMSHRQIRDAA